MCEIIYPPHVLADRALSASGSQHQQGYTPENAGRHPGGLRALLMVT